MLLFSHSIMSNSLRCYGLQHVRFPCPSLTPGACSNSCSLSQWRHPTISSSVVPFSSCLQSFPASGSFRMSWLFTSGRQSRVRELELTPVHPSLCHLKWRGVFVLFCFVTLSFPADCTEPKVTSWIIFKNFIYLFIFRLCWVFIAVRGLSLVATNQGNSLLWCTGFALQWLLLWGAAL